MCDPVSIGIGMAVGAGGAALTGGDPLQGALIGGATGGIGGGATGGIGGGAGGPLAGNSGIQALQQVTGQSVGNSFLPSLSQAFTVLSGVTSIIAGVAGPMMAHSAQANQAAQQRFQNEQRRKNAFAKAKADNEALAARQSEEHQKAANKKFKAHQITKSIIATKRVSLEGRGVLDSGTGDDLIRDLLFEEGQYTNSVTTNLNILDRQFNRHKKAIGLRHQSAVSGLQTPVDPSPFATGLQIVGNLSEDSNKIKRLGKIAERSTNG